jgi:hypothetical protein
MSGRAGPKARSSNRDTSSVARPPELLISVRLESAPRLIVASGSDADTARLRQDLLGRRDLAGDVGRLLGHVHDLRSAGRVE